MTEFHPLPSPNLIPPPHYQKLNAQAEKRARECQRAPMPLLHHLTRSDYDLVYEPSEDTFLLLDALRFDFEDIQNQDCIRFIQNTLEIGCGTGVVTIYLAQLLNKSFTHFHVTDINPDAIRITLQTAQINHISPNSLFPITCHLATPLLSSSSSSTNSLQNKMNIILFNPPYVPTPDEEVGRSTGIEASWAGGIDGRRVIDQALPQIASLLSREHFGVAYMIVVDDNLPHEIAQYMKKEFDITVIPWFRRKARNEYLTVLKMTSN
jgi:release factor glutamine methyltransferase